MHDTTNQPASAPDPSAAPSWTAAALEPAAITSLWAHVRFWAVVVLGLAVDLWSKDWAFRTLRQNGQRILIPNVLEFHTTLNPGALFGIGAGKTSLFVVASLLALALVLWMFAQCPARRWFTQIALGAILAGALGNMYDRIFVQLVPHVFAASSGARSVLYCERQVPASGDTVVLLEYPPDERSLTDELPRAVGALEAPIGYVRDFIKISQKWLGGRDLWPWVFNVADMLLVGGVGALTIRLFCERRPAAGPPKPEADASGTG